MIKILIVDDESYERKILSDIIDRRFAHEARIRMAENGRQAVDMAALWGADILLMDIEMPGLNGIEATRQILAQHSCKVIFITAYSLFEYAHEAVKLGASDYILKPVDEEDVERALRKVMGQIETQRRLVDLAPAGEPMEEDTAQDRAPVLMANVKQYLQHNYMVYDISLDSVSSILNVHPSYFSALFKRTFGVNFVDYLTELRIHAAKELLTDPMRSTAEVAAMVGYESANYFARAFKRKTGMTPTEFRRSSFRSKEGSL